MCAIDVAVLPPMERDMLETSRRSEFGLPVIVACLALILATPALSATAGMAVKPNAAALQSLHTLELRLKQLQALGDDTRSLQQSAQSIHKDGEAVTNAWRVAQRDAAASHDTLQPVADCLVLLQSKQELSEAALRQQQLAITLTHQAIQSVSGATEANLVQTASESDRAFQARADAEQAVATMREQFFKQAVECNHKLDLASRSVGQATMQVGALVNKADNQSRQLKNLAKRWKTLDLQAKHLGFEPQAVPTLNAAITRAAHLQASLPSSSAGLSMRTDLLWNLDMAKRNLQQLSEEIARLEDAVTYLHMVTDQGGTPCRDPGCLALTRELRGTLARLERARSRRKEALAALKNSVAGFTGQLSTLSKQGTGNIATLKRVAPILDQTQNTVAAATGSLADTAGKLAAQAGAAERKTSALWRKRYVQVHGRPPIEQPVHKAAAASAPPPLVAAKAQLSAEMSAARPELRSHAYAFFAAWNEEPRNFGAYTYVLLRSEADLNTPAVRRRFLKLLTTLEKLPEAHLVLGEDKVHTNVFCIPGSGQANGSVKYASDLGQQIKLRTQNGLLTRKKISRRLIDSPGPFLLTLPTRIAQANSQSALLFADLSDYPDDAIADLAASYMKGLVDDFPSQQALWRPPVLQRVALVMIHLADSTGEVITNIIPSAQAESPQGPALRH